MKLAASEQLSLLDNRGRYIVRRAEDLSFPSTSTRDVGAKYDAGRQQIALTKQIRRVYDVLVEAAGRGEWLTDEELAARVPCRVGSAGAQRRNLKKPRFGSHVIGERRRNGSELWEYLLSFSKETPLQPGGGS